jgi:hypothetical protein
VVCASGAGEGGAVHGQAIVLVEVAWTGAGLTERGVDAPSRFLGHVLV